MYFKKYFFIFFQDANEATTLINLIKQSIKTWHTEKNYPKNFHSLYKVCVKAGIFDSKIKKIKETPKTTKTPKDHKKEKHSHKEDEEEILVKEEKHHDL